MHPRPRVEGAAACSAARRRFLRAGTSRTRAGGGRTPRRTPGTELPRSREPVDVVVAGERSSRRSGPGPLAVALAPSSEDDGPSRCGPRLRARGRSSHGRPGHVRRRRSGTRAPPRQPVSGRPVPSAIASISRASLAASAQRELRRLAPRVDAVHARSMKKFDGAASLHDLDDRPHVEAGVDGERQPLATPAMAPLNARRLLISFIVVPAPTGPRWNVARPSRSSTGRQRRHRLVVAANHEHQRPVLRPRRPAGERAPRRSGGRSHPAAPTVPGCRPARTSTGRGGSTRALQRGPRRRHLVDDLRRRQGRDRHLAGGGHGGDVPAQRRPRSRPPGGDRRRPR